MGKRLTQQDFEDRMVVYDEAIQHLNGNVFETEGERLQGKQVANEICQLQKYFEKNHYRLKKLDDEKRKATKKETGT